MPVIALKTDQLPAYPVDVMLAVDFNRDVWLHHQRTTNGTGQTNFVRQKTDEIRKACLHRWLFSVPLQTGNQNKNNTFDRVNAQFEIRTYSEQSIVLFIRF